MKTKILLLNALLWCFSNFAFGAVIYVDADATGLNNGTSWANAYNELYDAIFNHADGDFIWVAEGTYALTNLDKETPHEINDKLTILGGFNGTESSASERNWDENVTIITGERGSPTSPYDNQRYFFVLQNAFEQASLTINGVIFEQIGNDDNPGLYFESRGASFQSQTPSELILRNSIIRNGYGQIYYCPNGSQTTLTVENVLIRDHENSEVFFDFNGEESTNRLVNCTIVQCDITYGDSFYSRSSAENTLAIHNSIVWANSFTPSWGAAPPVYSNETVTHTISEDVCEDCGLAGYSQLVSSNPRFVNAAVNNFHLQPLSPAINFGNNAEITGSINFDLDHNPRISFGLIDAGCYEETSIAVLPGVHFVDQDATGANIGTSWNDAFTSLYDALEAALPGEQIWVAEGDYAIFSADLLNYEPYYITKDLSLYGGFSGTEYDLDERNWHAHPTRITGELGDPALIEDNADILVRIEDGATALIDGFDLSGVYGYPTIFGQVATAFWANQSGLVTVRNCTLHDLYSNSNGIAFMTEAEMVFDNCLFHSNAAATSLTRVSDTSALSFYNCTIAGNAIDVGGSVVYQGPSNTGDCSFYNCISANNNGIPLCTNLVITTASNCVITDTDLTLQPGTFVDIETTAPLFVNSGNDDYRLMAISVGIDHGSNAFVNADFDLSYQPRIQFGTVDAGCYESDQIIAGGGVIYVDQDATGSNNGTNWINAFTTLTSALLVAQDGDEVWVAEGTYYPTLTTDINTAFVLSTGASIYGGFSGVETSRGQRNPVLHPTVLSGDIGIAGESSDNSRIVLDITGSGMVIDGLVFEGAYNDPSIPTATGGAVYAHTADGAITIRRSVFRNNTAHRSPALQQASQSELVVEGCLFHGNTGQNGIVMAGIFGSNTYINCTFANNQTTGSGPVFYSFGAANLTVANCIVDDNNGMAPFSSSILVDASSSVIRNMTANPNFTFTNCLDEDPIFIDAFSDNYRLYPGSPAFNLGLNSFVGVSTDLDGADRIRYGIVDAGAYESLNAIPGVIYVDKTATGANNGSSWIDAYTDLQTALASAASGDMIWVSEHVYKPHGSDRSVQFEVPAGVALFGGFSGGESSVEERVQGAYTRLSGNIGDAASMTDNTYHLMRVNGEFFLEGFIFEGANSEGSSSSQAAALGGISTSGTIQNCKFVGNRAANGFVVQFVNNADLMFISDCDFSDNENLASGVLSITSAFDAFVNDNRFYDNTCPTTTVISLSETGGGHHYFRRNAVVNNTVSSSVVVLVSGTVDVSNCFLKGNVSPGGVLGLSSSSSGNVVDAINNTIVENASGSLMGLNGSSGSNINVINNVFWGNTPGIDNNAFNGTLQLYNNVVEGGAASFGSFAGLASSVYDYDPQFVNPATDNYSFDSNSICFDTGIDQTIQGGDLDILGNPRLVNDYCDMGAFERQSCSRDNNLCSGALPLELDADWVYGNTRCSDDGGYPAMTCMGDVSGNVWYSFVAPASGAVDVRVRYVTGFQQLGGIATEVYGGSCGSPIPVGCHNDPLISPFLELTNLIAGATYRIRIEANGMSSLGFEVQVNTEVGPTCLGDFDLNGQVDAGDLLTFLSGFGCTGGCATDLDGDANTGSSDLLIFLSAFGTLCN